jgi:HEAT repeat protein
MIDSDSKQRSLILEALSQIGAKTFKPLNRALALSLQDDNAEVRKNAIRDLTRIYELVAQVTQMLCHAADDPDPEVQETARWAMSQLSRIRTPMALENLPPSQSSRNLLENHDQEPPR